MTDPSRPESDLLKSLRDRIARAEARQAQLAGEQAIVAVELRDLRAELASAETIESVSVPTTAKSAPQTPAEKVALFRSLFSGRDGKKNRAFTEADDRKVDAYLKRSMYSWMEVGLGRYEVEAHLIQVERPLLNKKGKQELGVSRST